MHQESPCALELLKQWLKCHSIAREAHSKVRTRGHRCRLEWEWEGGILPSQLTIGMVKSTSITKIILPPSTNFNLCGAEQGTLSREGSDYNGGWGGQNEIRGEPPPPSNPHFNHCSEEKRMYQEIQNTAVWTGVRKVELFSGEQKRVCLDSFPVASNDSSIWVE